MNGFSTNSDSRSRDILTIAGVRVVCDQRGVLFFPDLSLLAVSDLHLEKGSSFARRGAFLPPYDTAATLLRLQQVVADHDPRVVVSLGDSFHDSAGAERLPGMFRHQVEALAAGRDWFWIAGNHDPDAPAGLPGESVRELQIGALSFRHEPSATVVNGEIAGHLHPCARIVQRGRSVRRRCFASDGHRIIMPAFGSFTGSLNVLDRAYTAMFRWERFFAYMLGRDRVFPIARTLLRPG
ncbi:MAG: ligase-associated DNA damage response endonuclease PdeM [Rhizobiaceae bacterium]|nr:ligase-associated DNA damage response endonuclease PdeM [Rhizobiaceae bacterium]